MFKSATKLLLYLSLLLSLAACSGSTSGPTSNTACEDTPFSISILGPSSAATGNEFDVSIGANNVTGLVSAPLYVMYDPGHVSFVKATEGDFMKQGGAATAFMTSNDSASGRVVVGNSRLADRVGVDGSGILLTVTFKAEVPGLASFNIQNARLTDGTGRAHVSQICTTSVEII